MKSPAEEASIAVQWWRDLQPYFSDGSRNPRADRAALARLRRADLLGAMQDPATFALFRALGRKHPNDLPGIALCAAVLAGVRKDRPNQDPNSPEFLKLAGVREDRPAEHPARTLGPPSLDTVEQAAMKPLRFRRLIEAGTPDERLGALRRAVQLADRRLNLRELAAACLDWSDGRRQRWIFEYYNAGFAAPASEPTSEEAAA